MCFSGESCRTAAEGPTLGHPKAGLLSLSDTDPEGPATMMNRSEEERSSAKWGKTSQTPPSCRPAGSLLGPTEHCQVVSGQGKLEPFLWT